ncbi:MAG: DUF1223 domain-containing protein [Betaproteobacteria bacterium]
MEVNPSMRHVLAVLLAFLGLPAQAQSPSCSARSQAGTTALVELYTSEGCDSCPPADRWLSSLGEKGLVPGKVVPIALHVDYWDYIGWKDPYARPEFTLRQRLHAQLKRSRLVYTPQVILQGQDFRGWAGRDTGAFERELARINARPAAARISLAIAPGRAGALEVEAEAEVLDSAQRADAALYLATYENRLRSEVRAGENRGRTLPHDFVAFEWQGPLALGASGKLRDRRSLPLLPKANPAHSGVVAFVQNRASGEVLQALMRPACLP